MKHWCPVLLRVVATAMFVLLDHPPARAAAGTITTTLSPSGVLSTGATVTVTLHMTGYTDPYLIDRYGFMVGFNPAVFEYVFASMVINDRPGPDENWLRKPEQDGVGSEPILQNQSSVLPDCVVVDVSDSRSTFGGTTTSNGFLVSFRLRAIGPGSGEFHPTSSWLWNSSGSLVGSPDVQGASFSVGSLVPPTITQQPFAQTVPVGANVNIGVSVTGTEPFRFQWRKNGVNLVNGGRIFGANALILSIVNVQLSDAGGYSVVVSNDAGTNTSASGQLTVAQAPSISQPPTNQTIAVSNPAIFSVTGTGVPPPAYQWSRNGVPLTNDARISGVMTRTLTIANAQLTDNGSYSVVLSNIAGVVQAGAQLLVVAPPVIVLQPTNVLVAAGDRAQFRVGASGGFLSYRWTSNDVNVVDGVRIRGATTPQLTISNVQPADVAIYRCTITNIAGVLASAPARLEICTPPVILTNPVSQVAPLLSTVGFSVLAGGTPAPDIQWFHNDLPIPGATNSLLLVTNAHRMSTGLYRAVATNACGSSTSGVAELQVCVTLAGPILQGVIATDRDDGGGGGGGGAGRLASAVGALPFHGVPLLYNTYNATGMVACGAVTASRCKKVLYDHTQRDGLVTVTAHSSEFPTILVVTDRTVNRTVLACASANGPDGRSSVAEFQAVSLTSYNIWAGGVGTNTGAVRLQIGDAFQGAQITASGAFTFEVAGDVSSPQVGFTYTLLNTERVDALSVTWPYLLTVFPLTNDWVCVFTNPVPLLDLARFYGLRGMTSVPATLGLRPVGDCFTNRIPTLPQCGCFSPPVPP